MAVEVRAAVAADIGFLREMWLEAAFWDPDGFRLSIDDALKIPELARYIDGWGRPGDGAVVATDGDPVGAAWYRLFPADDPGYGYVDDRTPELGIGVVAGRRGQGIGALLLDVLCDTARDDGFDQICLSVNEGNFSKHLYEKSGFVVVSGPVDTSYTMVRTLI